MRKQFSRASLWVLSIAVVTCGLGATRNDYTALPAEGLTWHDVKGPDGSKIGIRSTDLWGDSARGAHGSLSLLPAGFQEPLHHHSITMRIVIIKGVMRFSIRHVETNDLRPGSFVSIAAGVPHFAHCVATVECEVFIEQDGAMDVKLNNQ